MCDPVFSVVMPYHNAPNMLREHARATWEMFVSHSDRVEFVICDDASAVPIEKPTGFCASLSLYRIPPPHIRWSHRCATNIAAHYARGEWLLVTDIDHVVSEASWVRLFNMHRDGALNAGQVYTFTRRNVDGSEKKGHPDSWLISRGMWNKIGGYDTRYRGHYGQNKAFQDRVKFHAGETVELPVPLTRYAREDIADASMPDEFGRKSPVDREIVGRMRMDFRADGTYWKPQPLVDHVKVHP